MRKVAALIAVIGILLAGCGVTQTATQPVRTVLNLGMPKPITLNSLQAQDMSSIDILAQVEQGLVTLNAQGVAQPGIAAKWSASDGGKVYTFDLRAAQWSNGDPVTAADFVYAWQQTLDPCNRSPNAGDLAPIAGAGQLLALQCKNPAVVQKQIAAADKILGVRAVTPTELRVTLSAPTWYWLSELAGPAYYPLDVSAVQKWGIAKNGSSPQYTLFDGPFSVTAWQPTKEATLVKNPDYWNSANVHLTQVNLAFQANTGATMVASYSNGTSDGLVPFIPNSFIKQFQGQPGFHSVVGNIVTLLMLNTTNPVLKNVYIRRALSEALNRQSLVELQGTNAKPATALVPPTVDYAPGEQFGGLVGQVISPTAQTAQAKADLSKGLRQLGLTKMPPLTILVVNQGTTGNSIGSLNAFWGRTLGLTVSVDALPPAKYIQDIGMKKYDMAYVTWQGNYNDPRAFLDLFTPGSQNDFSPWTNKIFARDMVKAGKATTNHGADLAAAEKELLSRMAAIPLFWMSKNWLMRPDVHGFIEYSQGNVDFNLAGVSMS